MLSGLLKPDKGIISIFSDSSWNHVGEGKIGVCMQTNVLYSDLTIKDHIMFYAKLEGFN